MDLEIIRSKKRKKTVSAREVNGRFIVRAPADMSEAELQPIIENLQRRWQKRQTKDTLDDLALHQASARSLTGDIFGAN